MGGRDRCEGACVRRGLEDRPFVSRRRLTGWVF
jgi:hypothetical protein